MSADRFDLVVVGGGIAGASLGKSMAEAGARVLILESSERFSDRVRGEALMPWGVAEAEALGLRQALAESGANEIRWSNSYLEWLLTEQRDIPATTASQNPVLSFYHPRMQTRILEAAESAGAEVRRGVEVTGMTSGSPVLVTYTSGDRTHDVSARIAALATGRNSRLRRSLGIEVSRAAHSLCIAGVLLEEATLPDDTFHWFFRPSLGEAICWIPEGDSRVRVYLYFWGDRKPRFGPQDVGRLLQEFDWTGMAEDYFSQARPVGPLATFESADVWAETPYKNGVFLLGDCAASNDPTWGQGLSIALRSSRTLRDALLRHSDWDRAGGEYAHELRRWYEVIRSVTAWLRKLFLETGAQADARRNRAFPLFKKDPSRYPELLFDGPDVPLDSESEARFFGADVQSPCIAERVSEAVALK